MFNKKISTIELSNNEKIFLFSIMPYISNIGGYITKNHTDITIEELKEITGLCRTVLYETIRSLMDKDILFKPSKNRYVISEEYLDKEYSQYLWNENQKLWDMEGDFN